GLKATVATRLKAVVTSNGRVSGKVLEAEQYAAHGLAWLATYAESLRQMAAYVAALEAIYPGRPVRAALLYTQTPQLIALPASALAPHKDHLGTAQQSYGDAGSLRY
ncbi:MAG: hypothetical protein AAFY47_13500, partial [Pseudomonadota bacterium]